MKRAYSNYTPEEFQIASKKAKDLGFSFSAYQHYCVMLLSLDKRDNSFLIKELIEKMFQNLEKVELGGTFIVSALLAEEWPSLSRSEKITMAKQLSAKVRSDSRFRASSKAGKTTVYTRISN